MFSDSGFLAACTANVPTPIAAPSLVSAAETSAAVPETVAPIPMAPDEILARLFRSKAVEPSWFTAGFVDNVPPRKVEEIIAEKQKELGGFERVDRNGSAFVGVFERGRCQRSSRWTARVALRAFGFRLPSSP